MPAPGEHKTVQTRILKYAQEIGWTYVPRAEAERRRGFDPAGATPEERARKASLFFGDLLHAQVRAFNPKYKEAEGALIGEFQRFHADIYGNRDFLQALRNQHKYFCTEENRELDLTLIDYGDLARPREQWRNVYEVTEEFYTHNGKHGTREDVVFLINGIPVEVIECKNASKDEAIALGVDQIRRYHAETPEVMVLQMLFTATEAIGFAYGVTWNTVRRNLFNWKHEEVGNLEAKVKSFCAVPHLLRFLKDFILFAEKEEELQKFILRQHQTGAVDKVVTRALDPQRTRGLVWHTQGSGKTYTMIKAAELLFKAPEAEKPTILLMIDRNELEDQMLKNLASVGLGNVAHANSIAELNRLLNQKGQDYRGIIVTTIHKFRDMPANLNLRPNIFVLIDEAHRTTGGDLGNFLMAGLPNATFLGFTGTPVDKTAYGKGTFKIFGCEDDQGYLHKYSIAESIEDGTTLPLYYNLAPNEMLVPHEIMEKEFLALAEAEGVANIKEIEMLYEIISPDAFLRPFIDPYTTLSSIYAVVRNAYAKKVYVDKAFQKKTNELVQKHIGALMVAETPGEYVVIDRSTIETIKQQEGGDGTKVINLVKSIEKTAEENSDDPFLVALAERAQAVQESFEDRQTSTADALSELLKEIEKNEQRKKEQAAKGLDGLTYFVLCKLTDDGIPNPETASRKVAAAFARFPNWQRSEAELREVRKQVTYALVAEEDDMEKVAATVEALFTLLQKSFRP